ncbi:hypothetical protein ElyMa_000240700 [Elysia marginata]|uniref:Uncharacterized protein n=1 Tax=Elysia marginata TaxID=1093978 RepID=A0AAV4F2E5_9GAST|nr:hypothetical protein ElyMa_000240700 [Elysia marginata]
MRGHKTTAQLKIYLSRSSKRRKQRETKVVENMDLTHPSRHAGQTIKKADPGSRPAKSAPPISPDEIAREIKERGTHTPNQSFENRSGKSTKQSWLTKVSTSLFLSRPIIRKEMEKVIKCMKG